MRQFEDRLPNWSHRRIGKHDESSQRHHPMSMNARKRLLTDMAPVAPRRPHKHLPSLHSRFCRLLRHLEYQLLLRKQNHHRNQSLLLRHPSNLHKLVSKLASKLNLTRPQMLPSHPKPNLRARLLQHQEHREPTTLEMSLVVTAVSKVPGRWKAFLGRVQSRVAQQVLVQISQCDPRPARQLLRQHYRH